MGMCVCASMERDATTNECQRHTRQSGWRFVAACLHFADLVGCLEAGLTDVQVGWFVGRSVNMGMCY